MRHQQFSVLNYALLSSITSINSISELSLLWGYIHELWNVQLANSLPIGGRSKLQIPLWITVGIIHYCTTYMYLLNLTMDYDASKLYTPPTSKTIKKLIKLVIFHNFRHLNIDPTKPPDPNPKTQCVIKIYYTCSYLHVKCGVGCPKTKLSPLIVVQLSSWIVVPSMYR